MKRVALVLALVLALAAGAAGEARRPPPAARRSLQPWHVRRCSYFMGCLHAAAQFRREQPDQLRGCIWPLTPAPHLPLRPLPPIQQRSTHPCRPPAA